MTAKRFIMEDGYLFDDEKGNAFLTVGDCCELLNEQHEQIQELIQSSKELEEDCQSTFNAMSRKQDDLYRKNFKLKEENEQLKKDVEYWKQVASQYSNELNVFEHSKKYKTECKDIHWSSD